MHTATTVAAAKKGEIIRFKENGTEYIRGDYDRTEKKYELTRWDDCSRAVYKKGSTPIYIGFTF